MFIPLRFAVIAAIVLASGSNALAAASIYCGTRGGATICVFATHFANDAEAVQKGAEACRADGIFNCALMVSNFAFGCRAAALIDVTRIWSTGSTSGQATDLARRTCDAGTTTSTCSPIYSVCESSGNPDDILSTTPILSDTMHTIIHLPSSYTRSPPPPSTDSPFDMPGLRAGISFGIGVIIVLLIYARRMTLVNFLIHRNLPYKLTVYADDVQILFKRTQRVNWYGRVVFGLTARLGLTEKQLALVRRYWLGRVIVFDSLRRQRQSELARMHFQLAADVKYEKPDATNPFSILWKATKFFFFYFLYIVRALISFLIGFLFIRVTISSLARGKLIESANLTLILQAKEAVEHSVVYLKEYLETAETFTGQENLFEPK